MCEDDVCSLTYLRQSQFLALYRVAPGAGVVDQDLDLGVDRAGAILEGLHDADDSAVVEAGDRTHLLGLREVSCDNPEEIGGLVLLDVNDQKIAGGLWLLRAFVDDKLGLRIVRRHPEKMRLELKAVPEYDIVTLAR